MNQTWKMKRRRARKTPSRSGRGRVGHGSVGGGVTACWHQYPPGPVGFTDDGNQAQERRGEPL